MRDIERLELDKNSLEVCVKRAATVLENGGVILYPTDTLYGLGADGLSDAAVDKIYEIKGRDDKKPSSCIVADMDMAKEYAEVGNDALLLADEFFPGKLTLILNKKKSVTMGIARNIDTLAIRIPDNDFCLHLAALFAKPFTTTSANISGLPAQNSVDAVLEQLGSAVEEIDLVIDGGDTVSAAPSTVVDLAHEEPNILREGAIPVADIWNVIREQRDN